jgi:HlyD family secretion protein
VHIQAYEDDTFEGVVRSVALASTEEKDGSKYYKAEVLLKDSGKRVLSGLNADVDIETRRHSAVLKIPSQAVLGRRVDDLPADLRDLPHVDRSKTLAPVVFRFVNNKAIITPVQVGPSDLTHSVILAGLSEGDQVIVGPYKVFDEMKHEQKVKDEKAATTQPADGATIAKSNGRTASATP